jgi:hypothetical protein
MLLRLALILVAIPAVALGQDGVPATYAAPPPAQAPAAPPALAKPPPPKPQLAALAPPPSDPADCRMACANANYMCRAGDNPDSCDSAWGQCVSTCDLPNLGPGFSTAP